jgi:hypothetical protein
MRKIAFRLNSKEAVEYANAHGDPEFNYVIRPSYIFHYPAFAGLHLYLNLQPGYEDVTETFMEEFYNPWDEERKLLASVQNREVSKDAYVLAVDDVLNEVKRAKSMFKENFVNQHEGYAVILEELDELWDEVKKNQKNYDLAAQRKEAIQCAAMCIRFIAELTPKQ